MENWEFLKHGYQPGVAATEEQIKEISNSERLLNLRCVHLAECRTRSCL